MKRYLYIIIGIIIAAVVAILVLFLIKNNSAKNGAGISGATGSLPSAASQGGNASGTEGVVGSLSLPSTASGTAAGGAQAIAQSFGVLSNDPVLDYFVGSDNTITAIEPTGEVISISNGQSVVVNSSTIDDIISAHFSYDGEKIVVSYGNTTNPQAGIFDAATNAWTALPQGMLSPEWAPINNYVLAYLVAPSAGKLTLETVNAANLKTKPTVLLSLNANDLSLQWPTADNFILADKTTSQNAGSIWVFNTQTGDINPLVYEVPGAESIWSNDAAIPYGLTFYNNPDDAGNTLQLQAMSGNLPNETLDFSTLPSKCAFNAEQMPIVATSTADVATSTATSTATVAAKTPAKNAAPVATSTPYLALYCGIPRSSSGFSSAQLPDDYNTMALFTSDDLYKINTATGAEQVLWSDSTQNMDVSNLKYFNNAIFFVNRYDNKLYGLTLSSQ